MYYTLSDKKYHNLMNFPKDGEYYGSLYYGGLCFDLVVREYNSDAFDPGFAINNKVVDLVCYILDIDSGYGYLNNDIPYDFYEYCGTSVQIPKNITKEQFLKECDKEIKSFIKNCNLKKYLKFTAKKWIHYMNKKEVKKLHIK